MPVASLTTPMGPRVQSCVAPSASLGPGLFRECMKFDRLASLSVRLGMIITVRRMSFTSGRLSGMPTAS
eukprot:9503823-Pyramimonas_sp.AAC.3